MMKIPRFQEGDKKEINCYSIQIIYSLIHYSLQKMKHKHFTFDIDYFPISNSNVFHNIKIQSKNKNTINNKSGPKRFSIKNQLNFQQIPEIMFFQKSIKKQHRHIPPAQNISPSSNQTKKSHNLSYDDIQWTLSKGIFDSGQKQRRVQSCPKPSQIKESKTNDSFLKNQSKFKSLIDQQKKEEKPKFLNQVGYFHRNSHKNSQLQSLQECQSQFDESSQNSLIDPKINCNTNNLRIQNINSKSDDNDKQSKKTKATLSEKHNKSKKTQKSHTSKNNQNNPENISNKQKTKAKNVQTQKEKDKGKIANSLFVQQSKKDNNKFISLNRKSYYIIGSKVNKHRSLNKDKKTKNKSAKEDGNIILTNGDLNENSTSMPSNCRNSSWSSTVNSKVKADNSKSTKQNNPKTLKHKSDQKDNNLFEIVKRTQKMLQQYKCQFIQLKKQKTQYQQKYEEANKKLNRIKQELQFIQRQQ